MPEVRFANDLDARRERAVEMMMRHIRDAGFTTDYEPDIEYLAPALVSFADEWASEERAGV